MKEEKDKAVIVDAVIVDNREVDGTYFKEWPCGCRDYHTVLSDGTMGWGNWFVFCPVHQP